MEFLLNICQSSSRHELIYEKKEPLIRIINEQPRERKEQQNESLSRKEKR